jgi:2-octaprenylphenol hydroxylase
MSADADVVVVGAGLTGACAAALLTRHARLDPARVVLIGNPPPPIAAGAAPELRVAAISRSSEHVLRAAGAWQRLDTARLCSYQRMRVWHESASPDGPAALQFDAADVGEPNLGYIAEMSVLTRACLDSFGAAGGTLISGELERLSIGQSAAQLSVAGSTLSAGLVVGADGADSAVRRQAGLGMRVRDYHQLAIVATVSSERPHDATAWQRFLRSGPLALLPLFDGSSSMVWSLDLPLAQQLLACEAHEFELRLQAAAAHVLGAMRLASTRASFPLRSAAAQAYVAPRCALIGDAAHVIHPLAGQGANLGLLDAAALCERVAAAPALREDVGALRVLRGYEQQRRTHNRLMGAAMSMFQGGFAQAREPWSALVNLGLGAVERSVPLKRAFARQALGLAGELPRLARASI